MPSDTSFHELFLEELQDIYDAEKQLVKALPKMAKAAQNPKLRDGFLSHLEETQGHVDRLEDAFRQLGENAKGKTCKAMKGLVEEGSEAMEEHEAGAVRDAALIGAAQRVEHYEIAAYGTVRSMAEEMGHDDVAKLLQQTLDEEGATDKKLTMIAGQVNRSAMKENSGM